MSETYGEFLRKKEFVPKDAGFEPVNLNDRLYPFQRDIVTWACRRGKAAVFADCGMGKTPMQLAWAEQVANKTGGVVLILAPLAVSAQTVREGRKFGIEVTRVRDGSECKPGINITNYEMLDHFQDVSIDGVVLDESSILKSFTGKTRNQIIDRFRHVPYKLACTATPSPNDYMELGNHSEFIGIMSRSEMLSTFFVHDGGDTSHWRLKGHAKDKFWDWVASWAVMITRPSDLGYEDGDFDLPKMHMSTHVVDSGLDSGDKLFNVSALTLSEQQKARRDTVEVKGDRIAQMVNSDDSQWLIWCGLNAESDYLARSIPDAVEVKGSDSPEHKEDAMIGFSEGRYRVLVTKPSIAGFGMNWQNCWHMAFCGMDHSYEQFKQAVDRCYRYGQTHEVEVHIVVTEKETSIVENVTSKRAATSGMQREMVGRAKSTMSDLAMASRDVAEYVEREDSGDGWRMLEGDCVTRLHEIETGSIGFSVFSPPFASLYTYSNSDRDMGNSKDDAEFMEHFVFMLKEL